METDKTASPYPDNETGVIKEPNEFFTEGLWRAVTDQDQDAAHLIRCVLYRLSPWRIPISDDPGRNTLEANQRAILHAAADELNRTDLFVITWLARLLLLVKDGEA